MLDLITAITFVWLTLCAWYSVHRLAGSDERSIHFVLLVFYLFCGMPLGMDLLIGLPDYAQYPNYYRVSRHEATCLIYCTWMAFVPPLCLYCQPQQRPRSGARHILYNISPQVRLGSHILLWSPLFSLIFSPNPYAYLTYYATTVATDSAAPEEATFNQYKSIVCMIVVLAIVTMITLIRKFSAADIVLIAMSAFQVAWIHGKRSIIAMMLFGCLYGLWKRNALRGMRLWVALSTAVFAITVMTYAYQNNIRGINFAERSFYYDSARCDFCRDAAIKQAIYAEIYQNPPVLEYRMQSLLFNMTCFIPRSAWPNKPWPYAVYVTATMLDMNVYEDLGWGMTTSILDESLANMGWFGLLCGPVLLGVFCRIGDSCNASLVKAITVVNGCLFLVLHLIAFMPLFALWAGAIAYYKYRSKAGERVSCVRPYMRRLPVAQVRRKVA